MTRTGRTPAANPAVVRGALAAALLTAVSSAVSSSGCGDPLLPSDYSGPPAAEVTGVIYAWTPTDKVAKYPMLSLEWLSTLEVPVDRASSTALSGQTLRFARSSSLQNDWDIGLPRPAEGVKLAYGQVKFSVGKLVYFDDRARDGRLDWRCGGGSCDVVKAVSSEYVVFVEASPVCRERPGQPERANLTPGFRYFRVEGGLPQELRMDEAMNFSITDRTPFDSDPSRDLRSFTSALLRLWSLDALAGC